MSYKHCTYTLHQYSNAAMHLQRGIRRRIIHAFSHVLSSLWCNIASRFHPFSHIHWYSQCQSYCRRAEYRLFPYLKVEGGKMGKHFGIWMPMLCLHPPMWQMEDCPHTILGIWYGPILAIWYFMLRCLCKGDPILLGAFGGRFFLCPPSSSAHGFLWCD